MKRVLWALVAGVLAGMTPSAEAQSYYYHPASYQLNRWYYYPYQYFPHNYWPAQTPRWPEAPGMPYQKPPAYQAYPAFQQPSWRYEMWQPQRYYRGQHFWLDQF